MTRAEVERAIATSGIPGLSIQPTTLGGWNQYSLILMGVTLRDDLADTLGVFDEDGKVMWLLMPPAKATISGMGIGTPLASFKKAFGSRFTMTPYPGVTFASKVRLQVQDEYTLDKGVATELYLLAPGHDGFVGEFA